MAKQKLVKFYWVRNKQTGRVSRVSALPYMGQNTHFEQVDDPHATAAVDSPVAPEVETPGKPKKPKKEKKAKQALPTGADEDDLSAGVTDDAEDGS